MASVSGIESVSRAGERKNETSSGIRLLCGCEYNPSTDRLEHDFSRDDNSEKGDKPKQIVRIRERGEHYVDSYNGESKSCSFGTNEEVCLLLSYEGSTFNFVIPSSF